MVQALSFSCDEKLLASVGGARDGNQLVLWNMMEGKSEAFTPASDQLDQECYDVKFCNRDPCKLVTVHHNAVKVWSFDPTTKKLKNFNCALGKITRYIICLAIDDIDEFAFCGTRSGDVLEVSLSKGIYSRSGPLKKKFTGAVNQVLCKNGGIFVGTSEGVFAKLDKTKLTTSSEIKFLNASVTGLACSESKVYSVTQRGDIRAVLASEPVDACVDFMTSN